MEIHYGNFSLINWNTRLKLPLIGWTKLKFGECHNVSLLLQKFLTDWEGRLLEEGTWERGYPGAVVRYVWGIAGHRQGVRLVQAASYLAAKYVGYFVIRKKRHVWLRDLPQNIKEVSDRWENRVEIYFHPFLSCSICIFYRKLKNFVLWKERRDYSLRRKGLSIRRLLACWKRFYNFLLSVMTISASNKST